MTSTAIATARPTLLHGEALSQEVQDTRSYHCDGRTLKVKSFIDLSDVQSLADGSYCFVPTSQRRRRLWWRNARHNKRHGLGPFEFSQLQGAEAIPLFAKAGDMVLSSQRGAHCGHPQHPQALSHEKGGGIPRLFSC